MTWKEHLDLIETFCIVNGQMPPMMENLYPDLIETFCIVNNFRYIYQA